MKRFKVAKIIYKFNLIFMIFTILEKQILKEKFKEII